jgi:AcrR family transcriptional regulator
MTIDHERRRQDIARIAIDLIAREGLAAATIRRIAAEAGFSTAAVTNYFADKEELLLWTFQALSAEGAVRFKEEMDRAPDDAIAPLLTLVPWCPANVRRWKAYLAFWDEAARNPYLASQLTRSTREGFAFLKTLLQREGATPAAADQACQQLNAFIQGMSLQMLVDQQSWPIERVRGALGEALDLAWVRSSGARPAWV